MNDVTMLFGLAVGACVVVVAYAAAIIVITGAKHDID